MANSSSRCSVVVAVSLAMAMVIAASSVKVVAAADEQAACNIEEVTVNNTAEVIKSGTDFKRIVLCWNTVQRVLKKGDHCFCELLNRVQAKVPNTIDGRSLCGMTEKISRCRGAAACSFPDDDVEFCTGALLGPIKDTSENSIQLQLAQHAPLSPPMSPFFQFAVRECCSKMSKLSAVCACEFRNTLQKNVGNVIELKRTLPCIATSGDCAME